MSVKVIFITIVGFLTTYFLLIRSLIIYKIRFKGRDASILLDLIKKEGKLFIIEEEMGDDVLPKVFTSVCKIGGVIMYFRIEERILQAGFSGTDSVVVATLLRSKVDELKSLIKKSEKKVEDIPIYILQPWDSQKIGIIKRDEICPEPFVTYDDINEDVDLVVKGKKNQTGMVFYGPAGNGKSFYIRYLSIKYKLPIYIVSLMPDTDNHSLIKMFGYIHGPAIVLFEDFDNYYKGRKCQLENPKFTFNTILNVIDGVYSIHDRIIFCMTANEINNIDFALRSRPSRFRFIKHVGNPNELTRVNMLVKYANHDDILNNTKGFSLDMLLLIRDRLSSGISFPKALEEIKQYKIDVQEAEKENKEKK